MNEEQFFKMQNSKLYRFFDRLSSLVITNLCGILISLCGLVVFGVFPAMFAITGFYNDILEQKYRKTFSTLFAYFKKYFWIANMLMLVTLLSVALVFYMVFQQGISMVAYVFLMTFVILVLLLNLYLPSVAVLYPEFSFGKKIVFCFVAACDRWKTTVLLMILYVVWIYGTALMPQLFMFALLSGMPWLSILFIKKALKPETIIDPTAPIPDDYYSSDEEDDNK